MPPRTARTDTAPPAWTLAPRYGHAAMISGIESLSSTHEQLIIGWTGDILSPTPNERCASDYDGYCKQTLWPLFHYLLWQDVATEYASADTHYPYYESANAEFARKIAEVYRPGDLIWVHDYHLLLVPRLVRESIPDVVLASSCTPRSQAAKSSDVFPPARRFSMGCLTYSYSRHFTSTCVRVCGYETTPRGIDVEGHVTNIMHCPVGVDADRVSRDITRPGIQPKLEALRTLYEGKKIIVGRDKLDVVKGLRAFEKLLQDYREWIGNVVMIQVTSPALTDSPKLERVVSELVAHINGEYGSLDLFRCIISASASLFLLQPTNTTPMQPPSPKKDEFYALLSSRTSR
ncbi:Alpha,alpha-trehalose-phosphate synthase [UDP-forming] A [Hypsizygus marmoreus]|uniref:Alpha,alpha-trehalose-phosphate synthase [UDP-forming] A n=1 Tax=Hypsizygus marmoreus TaxID=39966 RepID=A0A369K2Q7_HYPMA|nr:Alpha,alpha-trehalose-phosphate synthase [UDP-forming] A [Hypsizygus marmoreus]